MERYKNELTDNLIKAILTLKTEEECYSFFDDICTIKEIQDMAQRLDAAVLLAEGYSYQKIIEKVAISTATIGRVSKCLNYGTGGYKKAIEGLNNAKEQKV